MDEIIQQAATLSIFVYDSVFVSEEILIEIVIISIATFIQLYKVKFGKDLTPREALEKSMGLIHLIKTILLENQRQEKLIDSSLTIKE
jgi:hypothetical protein